MDGKIEYVNSSATHTMLKAVEECMDRSREKMGREYASGHEAWARIKQLLEDAKRDQKNVEDLHKEVWDAVKDNNEECLHVNLQALSNEAINLCMAFAIVAAEARRAANDLM